MTTLSSVDTLTSALKQIMRIENVSLLQAQAILNSRAEEAAQAIVKEYEATGTVKP